MYDKIYDSDTVLNNVVYDVFQVTPQREDCESSSPSEVEVLATEQCNEYPRLLK